MNRQELIQKLCSIVTLHSDGKECMGAIADFIIEDRARICKPLVKVKLNRDSNSINMIYASIDYAINLAGIGEK